MYTSTQGVLLTWILLSLTESLLLQRVGVLYAPLWDTFRQGAMGRCVVPPLAPLVAPPEVALRPLP